MFTIVQCLGDFYYAQLRGFLTDEYGEKSAVIRYGLHGYCNPLFRIRISLIRILGSI